ncbi:putative alpha-1,3-mannosyltransferase MNN14 [Fusarium oxysporum f. sp. albedinis]|nr:putative alpha-1,3-mannosyltransferase MNN14 [Fusarium oxysporum f. sp. albedinis]
MILLFTESISSQIYLHEIMIFYSTLEFATFITYGGFVCIFHCNGAYDIISLLHNCQDLHAEAQTSGQDTCCKIRSGSTLYCSPGDKKKINLPARRSQSPCPPATTPPRRCPALLWVFC